MKETLREREMGQESTAQGISKAGTEERQRRTGQWEGAEERSFRAYLEREEKSRNTVEKISSGCAAVLRIYGGARDLGGLEAGCASV